MEILVSRRRRVELPQARYDVLITLDVDDGDGGVHQHHVEEDVTLAMAMSEAQRQAEYMGSDNVKDIHIVFHKKVA